MKKQFLILLLLATAQTYSATDDQETVSLKDNIKEIAQELYQTTIVTPFNTVRDTITENEIDQDIIDIGTQIGEFPEVVTSSIEEATEYVVQSTVGTYIKETGEQVRNVSQKSIQKAKDAGDRIGKNLKDGIEKTNEATQRLADRAKNTLTIAAERTAALIKDATDYLAESDAADVAEQLFVDAPRQVGEAASDVWNKGKDAAYRARWYTQRLLNTIASQFSYRD